jgi:broad specificity polyphosphatase/5'/3'-nucleotidase SurE
MQEITLPGREMNNWSRCLWNLRRADCVSLGMHWYSQKRVRPRYLGINYGPNLGWDVTSAGCLRRNGGRDVSAIPPSLFRSPYEENVHLKRRPTSLATASPRKSSQHACTSNRFLNVNAPNLAGNPKSKAYKSQRRATANMLTGLKNAPTL